MNDPRVTYEKRPAKPKPQLSRWYLIITFAIAFALAFWLSWKLVFSEQNHPPQPDTTHIQQP